ncbi:DUF4178 domain-containing protein [Roseicyclus mahoneyensis]|uniref:Uncharacterized protein DUF4178 n=1 Tax=Roseicyclus mahoneyensis TaxID=164332 RepID=A0A316GSI2_9RHOB|nr:DUF4178 domain-containing protein [Roseicyclus mahoneyensis]PWK57987.1 uncharacterized protein DUF4178 [Roseicyclus mahoneyensis]
MTSDPVSCPNCGYGFDGLRRSTRMFDCPSCDTTLFREGDALAPIGNHGEMHETPMLIGIGDTVEAIGSRWTVLGHVRYDYGRGFWDEMWAETPDGAGAWLSIDEGDVVIQRSLAPAAVRAGLAGELRLGVQVRIEGEVYTVTEMDEATATAFRGELPERIELGERHRFVNASGGDGTLLSGEVWDGGETWFVGEWLDPFEIKVERQTG